VCTVLLNISLINKVAVFFIFSGLFINLLQIASNLKELFSQSLTVCGAVVYGYAYNILLEHRTNDQEVAAAISLPSNDSGQVINTHISASVTEQYNLVLTKGR